MGNNDLEYSAFPFIWFLIALFHDNAYQVELSGQLNHLDTLDKIYAHFSITRSILDEKTNRCNELSSTRRAYLNYKLKERHSIDHGIIGGILLFDRLVKIRKLKKSLNEGNLFWGIKLVNQYRLAAHAITLHNIWLPDANQAELYEKYGLGALNGFHAISFSDFPLFYILAMVDTIEPLKTYRKDKANDVFSDEYILNSFEIDFDKNGFTIQMMAASKLDFKIMLSKIFSMRGWLELGISSTDLRVSINFLA